MQTTRVELSKLIVNPKNPRRNFSEDGIRSLARSIQRHGLLSPLTVGEAVAVSAGFGWYTLAPSMITEAGHAVAGAISFMHNVIRETLGIIIIPLAAQKIGYIEATAIPGVSAMDVCMPIVERSCNQETLVYSFCTGALMCIVVPLLAPLVIG